MLSVSASHVDDNDDDNGSEDGKMTAVIMTSWPNMSPEFCQNPGFCNLLPTFGSPFMSSYVPGFL